MKTLILISLICLSFCCDLTVSDGYNGVCITKSCLTTKMTKLKLTLAQSQDSTGNSGTISLGLSYYITSSVINSATAYQVTIRYVDDINNQLLGDRVNCIDFRIYSTNNAGNIDPTRRFILTPGLDLGQIPSWPISSYNYNQQINSGVITFNMSQADLQNNCLNPTGALYVAGSASSIQYNCYFELAYLVASLTQASYYFGTIVTINTSVSGSTTQGVTVLPIVQSTTCTAAPCSIAVTVASSLAFCKDSTCAVTAATPFVTLFVNRQFFMKHLITDAAFTTGFTLQAPSMAFQGAPQLNFLATTLELFPVYKGSYNIYQVTVPLVSNGTMMTATATLTLATALTSGSRILAAAGGQTTTTHLQMGPSRKASDRTKCLTYKSKQKSSAKAQASLCKTNSTGKKCINATALAAKTSKLAVSSCAGMTFASN